MDARLMSGTIPKINYTALTIGCILSKDSFLLAF